MLEDDGERRELPDYLEGWDYNTRLALSRQIRVDLVTAFEEARLAQGTPLALTVCWFSNASWLRGNAVREHLEGDSVEKELRLELGGFELGGTLSLETALILSDELPSEEPFTAHLPGSVLWRDQKRVRLQGDAPLFPISVVDFERAGFPTRAGWMLDVGTDLEAALLGSLRLYLNSHNDAVVTAFASAGAPKLEDERVLSAVYADVAKVMLEHALNQENILDGSPLRDVDSLGFALQQLVKRYFGEEDPTVIRTRRIEHPADFAAEVFSCVRVFSR
jgi:hypothetical protein